MPSPNGNRFYSVYRYNDTHDVYDARTPYLPICRGVAIKDLEFVLEAFTAKANILDMKKKKLTAV